MKVTDEMARVAACVYLGKSKDCALPSGNIDDMRKAIEAAIQAAWVSVDDKLPEEYDDLIVLDEDMDYSYAYRKGENWVSDSNVGIVTHWMPLPDYKEPTP